MPLTRTELHPVTKFSTSKTNFLAHNYLHQHVAGHAYTCDIRSRNLYNKLVRKSTRTRN